MLSYWVLQLGQAVAIQLASEHSLQNCSLHICLIQNAKAVAAFVSILPSTGT